MFIPEFDQGMRKDSFNPGSDAEQHYLVSNHLDVLATMISDALRRERFPESMPDAMARILQVLEEYLWKQEEDRPWSWAARLKLHDTVLILQTLAAQLSDGSAHGRREILRRMRAEVQVLLSYPAP